MKTAIRRDPEGVFKANESLFESIEISSRSDLKKLHGDNLLINYPIMDFLKLTQ